MRGDSGVDGEGRVVGIPKFYFWGKYTMPLGNFLEIRCPEIGSEAILGQKHSHTSYLARGVLHPIFICPRMHLLSQLTLNFPKRRY